MPSICYIESSFGQAGRLKFEEVLILASASPRRRELLTAAGIDHIVRTASITEKAHPGESAHDLVQRLAREKAEAVRIDEREIVLGADTLVAIGDQALGKPSDPSDARRMLRLLSGRDHLVLTGTCLLKGSTTILDVSRTSVTFADLTDSEIDNYVRTGESTDKAGAYAIQGLASKFIVSIHGSYHNVVGLPVALIYRRLGSLTE